MKEAKIVMLAHAEIAASELNPRKHYSEERLDELMQSMREHGFTPALSHLLVRPRVQGTTNYELVCGERRWRAAGRLIARGELAPEVPAVVMEMDDAAVLELQLVENLQREDLTPMEEAMGLRALLELRTEGGEPVYSLASLAVRVGRSESGVRQLLSLCKLHGTAAGEALESGRLPLGHARLIAKVPGAESREALTQEALNPNYGEVLSRSQLEDLIAERFVAELATGEFDPEDAALVPVGFDENMERAWGGACGDCPFNSKNTEDGVLSRKHKCLNVDCFRMKQSAAYQRWAASVEDPEKKRTALPMEEAAELWSYDGRELAWNADYVDLKDEPDRMLLRVGLEKSPAWKKILKDSGVPVVLAKDEAGKVHELVARDLALEAARLAEAGKPESERIFRSKMKEPTESSEKRAARAQEESERWKLEEAIGRQLMAELVAEATKSPFVPAELWPLAAECLVRSLLERGAGDDVCALMGWESGLSEEAIVKRMRAAAKEASICGPFMALFLAMENENMMKPPAEWLKPWAKLFGWNMEAARKAAAERLAQKAKEKDGLRWSANNDDMERGELVTEADWNVSAIVWVRQHGRSWLASGEASGVATKSGRDAWREEFEEGARYDSRAGALRSVLLGVKKAFKEHDASPAAVARVNEALAGLGGKKGRKG